ncbi:hypothetical protein M426DRAFT_180556 [Hypoxylon sp. CI-4A]|nr:hypothetical protein M426DRAFT_180556 [Hypoxylon sp. CI-4A]
MGILFSAYALLPKASPTTPNCQQSVCFAWIPHPGFRASQRRRQRLVWYQLVRRNNKRGSPFANSNKGVTREEAKQVRVTQSRYL